MKKVIVTLMVAAFAVVSYAGGKACADKANAACAGKDQAACAAKAQAACAGKDQTACAGKSQTACGDKAKAGCCAQMAKKEAARKMMSPKASGEVGR